VHVLVAGEGLVAKSIVPPSCEQHYNKNITDFEGDVPYGDECRSSLPEALIANSAALAKHDFATSPYLL